MCPSYTGKAITCNNNNNNNNNNKFILYSAFLTVKKNIDGLT